jgi:hypothetical protein
MAKIKTLIAMILLVAVTLFLSTVGRAQTNPINGGFDGRPPHYTS